jgi:hypothetical protein
MGILGTTRSVVIVTVIGTIAGILELVDGSALVGWIFLGVTAGLAWRRLVLPLLAGRSSRL